MKKGNSIVGGLILLIAGIGLLWWNEGNNVKNIQSVKEGLENYADIKCEKVDQKFDGKLVATNGELKTEGIAIDYEFDIRTESPVLYRKVEMYQWKEECEDNDNCTYTKVWSEDVIDSSNFIKEGHGNPGTKTWESDTFINSRTLLGAFLLPDELIKKLPMDHRISDLKEITAAGHGLTVADNYFTNVKEGKPEVGNVRISFYDNNSKKVSVLAEQIDDSFKVYTTKSGKTFFNIYDGTYNGNDMFTMITKQNNFMKWLWRIVGTLICIGSISSLFNPLTLIMNKIPILGSIVNGATGLISFVLGLSISLIVIAIAWFRFRPLLSIILIIIVVALIIGLKMYSKNKPEAQPKEA